MQLNWASFGSGVSSVCIILTLSILLFFCWRQNKKANKKQHEARLHEIAVIAGRDSGRRLHGHHSTPIRDNLPPYPPAILNPSINSFQGPGLHPFQTANSYGSPSLHPLINLQTPMACSLSQLQQLQPPGNCLLYTSPSPRDS